MLLALSFSLVPLARGPARFDLLRALPAHAEGAEQRFTLPNGLKVVIAPDPEQDRVCVLIRYALGHRDDPVGYRGLSHLTEHMTFRVGATMSQLESLGATDFNGITTADETYYYALIPPVSLQSVLWLEAQRMAFSASDMRPNDLKLEQRIVLREWSDRFGNEASALQADLSEKLYPSSHPYARRHDRPRDVRAADLADVQWFTQANYRPEKAVLAITGKVDPAEAMAFVQRYFGSVKGTGPAATRAAPAPASLRQEVVVERSANIAHELLIMSWLLPGYDSQLLPALDLSAQLLSLHLRMRLVEPDGPASSVSAYLERSELQSMFVIVVLARGKTRVAELRPQVDAVLAELSAGHFDKTALEAAQTAADRAAQVTEGDLGGQALRLARGLPYQPNLYRRVSATEVQMALRNWLPHTRRAVGIVTSEQP
jgi:zinc protease